MAKAERPDPTLFEKFEDVARRIFQMPKKKADKAASREKKALDAREAAKDR